MKLWQKISAVGISILLVVVIACCTLLLLQAKESIVRLSMEQVCAAQKNLISSFEQMVQYYLDGESNPAAVRSGIVYCFKCFADAGSVLIGGDGTLFSAVRVAPEEWLPIESGDGQALLLEVIDGRDVLIVGSAVVLLDERYIVYTVQDVTEVFDSIDVMTWNFVWIGGTGALLGTALMILLVRRTTKPLAALKASTKRIAVGEYAERAKVESGDEVGELATDFNVMAGAVQAHIADLEDRAKRQQLFIGGLTHEFRTPMASMMIHSETLLSADLRAEEAQNSLAHIHAQCRWLEQLTQKLLSLITLQEHTQMLAESMQALFDDIAESMIETLQTRRTPLVLDCAIDTLCMDYDLMKSLLMNLIDNASKASAPGQAIRLRAYDNILEVRDDGRGIAQEEIARIKDAFYMVDRSRNKKTGGSGLGLALVKRIAEVHGAELAIESQVGIGTKVCVIFSDKR